METIEELNALLEKATVDDAWGQLLYRGAARSLIQTDGVLPDGAPNLGRTIQADLAEYGFAVLRAALALREQSGASSLADKAFESAAKAFESLVRNGDPDAPDRGFYRTLAAASYHLAGYSAVAYSLFNEHESNQNSNPAEMAIACLVLRNMNQLRSEVRAWIRDPIHDDEALSQRLEAGDIDGDDAVATILNNTVCQALAFFDFALQTGVVGLAGRARNLLTVGVELAGRAGNVPLWWIGRICRLLIDDLWSHSLHVRLPAEGPAGSLDLYPKLRDTFIASLYTRKVSEVELWPSQREAVDRAVDISDDLVVALPTSAGKTRVAEIATLMALATGKRVLIVTPLRALSAQTERCFRKTFLPLGFSVSSLYGASGISAGDADALRDHDIVVATPEKLDFALRNDASLIDDVGLIVLDEGHMIGPTEREIRYETLVQRLLRRQDADARRIVCLSAVLPSGEELDDLTAWIRSGEPGRAVCSDWRPTRQRFGALIWNGRDAQLNYDLLDGGPFIPQFVSMMAPRGRDPKPFPRGVRDLSLQAAWKFAQQHKRVLIFVTQANWVEGFGRDAVRFVKKGYLPTLLDDPEPIKRALAIGREWLGEGHPAVAALQIGVAIHHGRLPSPFLRELEVLLSEGALKVIVASPTLSQGLNLNAAVLLVPYLTRSGEQISPEEFANVAGRAGRAFVDSEGLIAHVIFDRHARRLRDWKALTSSIQARVLQSGLIQVIAKIVQRLARNGVLARDDAFEYLANSRGAWGAQEQALFPGGDADSEEASSTQTELSRLVERLDTTVYGLVDALDANADDLPRLLDEALAGSLWERQIAREPDGADVRQKSVMLARARIIWNNTTPLDRKGHFAMGVGMEAGLAIDAMADELAVLLDRADSAALSGDVDDLSGALAGLAARLLVIRPFVPDKRNALPDDWGILLTKWVSGASVEELGADNMGVVEDAFAYRLVWALEAIRMRRVSRGWESEIVEGGGAAALETGVPRLTMAMLIRAGLPSRSAATKVVEECEPDFATPKEMRAWIASDPVAELSQREDWPTAETAAIWQRFRQTVLRGDAEPWANQTWACALDLAGRRPPVPPGIYRIEVDETQGKAWLATPDFQQLAPLKGSIHDRSPSVLMARVDRAGDAVSVMRLGSGEAEWSDSRR